MELRRCPILVKKRGLEVLKRVDAGLGLAPASVSVRDLNVETKVDVAEYLPVVFSQPVFSRFLDPAARHTE